VSFPNIDNGQTVNSRQCPSAIKKAFVHRLKHKHLVMSSHMYTAPKQ